MVCLPCCEHNQSHCSMLDPTEKLCFTLLPGNMQKVEIFLITILMANSDTNNIFKTFISVCVCVAEFITFLLVISPVTSNRKKLPCFPLFKL